MRVYTNEGKACPRNLIDQFDDGAAAWDMLEYLVDGLYGEGNDPVEQPSDNHRFEVVWIS